MPAWLYVLEAYELLGENLAPFHTLYTVLIAYVEVISQIDALKQNVEASLMIRQSYLALAQTVGNLLAECIGIHVFCRIFAMYMHTFNR